jgi:hypothetical protein
MIRHWFRPLLAQGLQPAAPQQLRQLLKALQTCLGCGDDAHSTHLKCQAGLANRRDAWRHAIRALSAEDELEDA